MFFFFFIRGHPRGRWPQIRGKLIPKRLFNTEGVRCKRRAQGQGERTWGRGKGGIWGTHARPPPNVFEGTSHGKALPHACACTWLWMGPFLGGIPSHPRDSTRAQPGVQDQAGPGGDFGKEKAEIASGCEAELPKRLTRLRRVRAGWQPPDLRQKFRLWSETEKKKKRKFYTSPPFVSLFTPLPVTTRSPPSPKPAFSMTSFDEILQHRNLQPASAQNFLGVFWQDPVPAIQIGSSDNKLRALPLRHNRFPQRSSKYLRVFISLLRDG